MYVVLDREQKLTERQWAWVRDQAARKALDLGLPNPVLTAREREKYSQRRIDATLVRRARERQRAAAAVTG